MIGILHGLNGTNRGRITMDEAVRPEVLLIWIMALDGKRVRYTYVYSHSKKDPADPQGERICHYREALAPIVEQRVVLAGDVQPARA